MNHLLSQLLEQRAALRERRDAILAAVESRDPDDAGRRNLTADEDTEFRSIATELGAIDPRIEELADQERRDRVAADAQRLLGVGSGTTVSVRSEPLTYDRQNRNASYFRDLGLAYVGGDQQARERLQSHRREMDVELPKLEARQSAEFERQMAGAEFRGHAIQRRDINRTDGTGGEFVPPLWILSEYAEYARAGRTTLNLCRTIPLPGGTDSISVPRISGGTAVAAQSADNGAVQETDLTTATVTAPVRTYAGQQDIALQLLEQSPLMFDEIVFADLMADHNAKLDAAALNGAGTSGTHTGFLQLSGTNSVSYTDASPTVPEFYPYPAQAISQAASGRKLPPTAIVMHSRRWFWMLAALDSSNRPLVVPIANGPYMAMGVSQDVLAEGPAGVMHGLPVYLDPNIPTTLGGGTEDAVIAARFSDSIFFEGAIRTRALPEVLSGTLTVRLQVYSYSAFMCGRQPAGISKITGTGLAAPSGF